MAQDDEISGKTYFLAVTLFKSKDEWLPTAEALSAAIEHGIHDLGIDDNRFTEVVVYPHREEVVGHTDLINKSEIQLAVAQFEGRIDECN